MNDQMIQLADPITLAVLGGLLLSEMRSLRRELGRVHDRLLDVADRSRDDRMRPLRTEDRRWL